MKPLLMFRNRDFDLKEALPFNAQALVQDLQLDALFDAMAEGDKYLRDAARMALLTSLKGPDDIQYRQSVLKDCLHNQATVRAIYTIAVEAVERERHVWGTFGNYPSLMLHRSLEVMAIFTDELRKLADIAAAHRDDFHSEGFTTFFNMIASDLSDEYFDSIRGHLMRLRFDDGLWINAKLGKGLQGTDLVLRRGHSLRRAWTQRVLNLRKTVSEFTLCIGDRDETGARALSDLKDRAIASAAAALAESCEHILNFFRLLRAELAFYIGCLNLHSKLAQNRQPVCFPTPAEASERVYAVRGLYDVCLALRTQLVLTGNDLETDGRGLVVITGANKGGKSTFLRSVGIAQLMFQSGMFVPAESFCASPCVGLFTHFKREEDPTMKHGKLDEELSRMSEIVDHLAPNSLVLFNESFAATNEREGSEIAWQITCALLEGGIRVFFVTHLYEFAHRLFETRREEAVFLRAEREENGERSYKLLQGEPLQTSFGRDLYERIFRIG